VRAGAGNGRGARLARLLHGPGMAPSGGPTRIVARAGARRAVKFFSPFGPGRDRPGLPGRDPGHGGPTGPRDHDGGPGPGPGPTDGPSVTLSRGCLKALARSGPGRCVRAEWEGPDRAARRRWACWTDARRDSRFWESEFRFLRDARMRAQPEARRACWMSRSAAARVLGRWNQFSSGIRPHREGTGHLSSR
jgi:hypothetical protein